MYKDQVTIFSEQIQKKVCLFEQRPTAILIGGLMAGAYVGLAIILIMTIGTDLPPEFRKLVMGATFGLALILVIFAGSELFTGYTMYCTFGVLERKITVSAALKVTASVWVANLIGAIILAYMYKLGSGVLVKSTDTVLHAIAVKKMYGTPVQLLFNAVLCNWLVCLALWIVAKINSESAKCIAIFWCLLAFIASGYEHSVANMTVFSLALLGPTVDGITLSAAAHNLFWVTIGNTIGGAVFVATGYWYMSQSTVVEVEPLAK